MILKRHNKKNGEKIKNLLDHFMMKKNIPLENTIIEKDKLKIQKIVVVVVVVSKLAKR